MGLIMGLLVGSFTSRRLGLLQEGLVMGLIMGLLVGSFTSRRLGVLQEWLVV